VAGAGQLGIFLAASCCSWPWFVDEMRQFYGLMFSDNQPRIHYWLLFAASGCARSGGSGRSSPSLSLMREAKRNEREAS